MKKIKLTEDDLANIIAQVINDPSNHNEEEEEYNSEEKPIIRRSDRDRVRRRPYSAKARFRAGLTEDAGRDTPGGNPDYFYGDGSLDRLRNMSQDEVSELSTEEIIKNLWQIKRLLSENAPAIAMRRVTELLGKLGADISSEIDYPEPLGQGRE